MDHLNKNYLYILEKVEQCQGSRNHQPNYLLVGMNSNPGR